MIAYDPDWRRTDRITHKHELADRFPEQLARDVAAEMNSGKPDHAALFKAAKCSLCKFWHVRRNEGVYIKARTP